MADMFGVQRDGGTVAKVLFSRRNSYRKIRDQPVRVSVNREYLPFTNIFVSRNGVRLSGSELARLEEDISEDLMASQTADGPSAASISSAAGNTLVEPITFHTRYREIWSGSESLESKILRTREALGNAMPRQYVLLRYGLSISVDREGNARFEFDITVCNWGVTQVERSRHEFRFDDRQNIPFAVSAHHPDRVSMTFDNEKYKAFFIEFDKPIEPGGLKRYRFGFVACADFSDCMWDFQLGSTLINHIAFSFTKECGQRVVGVAVQRVSDAGLEPIQNPESLHFSWDGGIAVMFHVPFVEVGAVYRMSWTVEPESDRSPGSDTVSGPQF